MAAKKSAPKATKVKKTAAAKPATKKTAPVIKKPPPKPEPVKRNVVMKSSKASAKPVAEKPAKKAAAPLPPTPAPPVRKQAVRATEGGEDAEANDNLLSGPRNVQPYVAKRGEQYMSKEQLEHFRTILSSWKQDLMLEVDRTVSHMKDEAANFPDPNDRATQEEEFSLELRTRDRERKLIRKIDEALGRIEDGSYGYCLETGEQIGVKRLEARPVATLSIEAQERRERREKQYGDRDDRYR
ncbi:MAG: RNA polymerase-binding protein DksA [Pseudomonadota bacterium]